MDLQGAASERLTEVKSRLAVLGTSFMQNLLAEGVPVRDLRDHY